MSDNKLRPVILKGGWADGIEVKVSYARCVSMPGMHPDGAYSDTYMIDGDVGTFVERIKFATQPYHSPITEEFFNCIVEMTPKDGIILELGSGTSTYWLSKERVIYSIESQILFYGAFQPTYRYVHCPIDPRDGWYSNGIISKAAVQLPYNTLLIDGPDMPIGERVSSFLKNAHLFNDKATWFFDDVADDNVWPVLKEYAKEHNRELLVADKSVKPWAVMKGVAA